MQSAASRVAAVPTTQSMGPSELPRLPRKQPTVSPGTAAAVNTGRIVSASEMRTWMTPLARPSADATRVSTTYRAAVRPPMVMSLVFILFTFQIPSFSFV